MKFYILSFVTFFYCANLFAHSGVIQGTVIDDKTNSVIEYAKIAIPTLQMMTVTNHAGLFLMNDIKAGNYVVKIHSLGYQTEDIEVVVKEHETTHLYILLKQIPLELNEVKIQTDQIANANSLSVIDINTRPINTSQDILRVVPGLFIAQHAGGGKAEQIFLRGFDCDHGTDINISVDGMPVNMVSHAHGQGYADLHFVIPESIEKVNVRKGPYQASIGNMATAGAVQFQTKNKIENNLVSIEAGRFNMVRSFAMVNLFTKKMQAKNQNMYVAGEYYYRQGYFDNPDNLYRSNILLKYNGSFQKHHKLTLQLSNFSSHWSASGQIPERAVNTGMISRFGSIDPTEGGRTSRLNASFKIESDLHHGKLFRNQFYFNQYAFDLNSNFTFYKNDTMNGDKINQREKRKIYGYNSSFFKSIQIGSIYFNTEIGLQARYDQVSNSTLNNVSSDNNLLKRYSLGDINELNLAMYIDENIDLTNNFRINIGLRKDYFNFQYQDKLNPNSNLIPIKKDRWSPKFNMYYSPAKNLQLYILSGIGFHSNDARVVSAQNGYQILPPAYGAEIGGNYKPIDKLIMSASLWGLYMKQEFVYVGDEAVIEPSGKTKRIGLDIGLRFAINRFMFTDFDFNYSIPRALEVSADANRIPLAPTISSIGGIGVKFSTKWNASLRYRYLADRPANEDNSIKARGYFLSDAVLEYTMKRFIVGLSAENIFNSKWKEAQFVTETRLKAEKENVEEIHFTAGTPFYLKAKIGIRF